MTEESDRERPQDREIAEKARAGLEQMRTLREDLDETIELTNWAGLYYRAPKKGQKPGAATLEAARIIQILVDAEEQTVIVCVP